MSVSSIEVRCGGKRRAVVFSDGETLLAALRNAGFSLSAACGGKGKCGKCRVRINGVQRLACRVAPAEGDVVELPETAGGAILTATVPVAALAPVGAQEGIAAAVDLGTTTVAVRLYDLKTAAELTKEQAESAASMARSQAEMAADAAKKAAGEAKKDSADFATALKHDVLEAQMAMMTPEQRAEFAAKAAEIAARDKADTVK